LTAAQREVAELDKSLVVDGEDFILRRVIGAANQTNIDVLCRGFVRRYKAQELTSVIIQGDSNIIMSPTRIIAAQWPGGTPVTASDAALDRRVPRKNDKVVLQGKVRNIETAEPIYIANELVRIEIQVRG
jgi:hypothetical protein